MRMPTDDELKVKKDASHLQEQREKEIRELEKGKALELLAKLLKPSGGSVRVHEKDWISEGEFLTLHGSNSK
jgi:thymidine phosphorylase